MKALSRYSNTINEPLIVQDDDQYGQNNVELQQNDVDEQTQLENDILTTEFEGNMLAINSVILFVYVHKCVNLFNLINENVYVFQKLCTYTCIVIDNLI